jgi:hypothetical protein
MREYHPDSWKIIEVDSPENGKIHKILASWYGGFTTGDSWKISSGIVGVKIEGKVFTMPQYSGSVYICHQSNEHVSGIMGSIYASFVKQLAESGTGTIRMIDWEEYLESR